VSHGFASSSSSVGMESARGGQYFFQGCSRTLVVGVSMNLKICEHCLYKFFEDVTF